MLYNTLQTKMNLSIKYICILFITIACIIDVSYSEFQLLSSQSTTNTKRVKQAQSHNNKLHDNLIKQIERDRKVYINQHNYDINKSNNNNIHSQQPLAVNVQRKSEWLTDTNRRKGIQKLESLLRHTANQPIYSVSPNEYIRYINDQPRPYWTLVSLTALSAINQCTQCIQANDALRPVAKAYSEQHNNHYNISNNIFDNDVYSNNDIPVFFLNVDVQRNSDIFKELKLQHAPVILLLPPTLSDKQRKVSSLLNSVPSKYKFNTLTGKFSPQDFEQFIKRHTGINDINVVVENVQPGFTDIIIPLLSLIGVSIAVFYNWNKLISLQQNKNIRSVSLVCCWLFYMYCVSGGMYNSIRGTLWAEYDSQTQTTRYINRDVRDQHASEGYIMGVCIITAALMNVLMDNKAIDTAAVDKLNTNKQNILSSSSSIPINKWYTPILQLVDVVFKPIVSGGVGLLAWYCVLAVYSIKNYGYNMGYVI